MKTKISLSRMYLISYISTFILILLISILIKVNYSLLSISILSTVIAVIMSCGFFAYKKNTIKKEMEREISNAEEVKYQKNIEISKKMCACELDKLYEYMFLETKPQTDERYRASEKSKLQKEYWGKVLGEDIVYEISRNVKSKFF